MCELILNKFLIFNLLWDSLFWLKLLLLCMLYPEISPGRERVQIRTKGFPVHINVSDFSSLDYCNSYFLELFLHMMFSQIKLLENAEVESS